MSLNADYAFTGEKFEFTKEMKNDFQKYGYVVVRKMLDEEELVNVKKGVDNNAEIAKNAWGVADTEGRYAKLALWHSAGDDVAGMVARCEKVVDTAEGALGGEVYHYYTKLMMKDPKNPETGGGHEWHQDYGYWYQNDILFPDMITVFIAIDRAHKANGCLQILEGSNNCGRIDHKFVAGQQGADVERVDAIAKVCPLKFVELDPGDALFFHGNLVHCSASNNSQDRRYAFLITYNKATNNPVSEHHFKNYSPLAKVITNKVPGLLLGVYQFQCDALFFHGNLIHCSAPNNSQDRRYAFLITYNKATNNPAKEHHYKSYTPLSKVPNSSIRECRNYNIGDFFDPATQKTIKPKKFGIEQ